MQMAFCLMENLALPMAAELFDQPQPALLSAPVILGRSEERRVLATETHQPPPPIARAHVIAARRITNVSFDAEINP